MEKIIGYMIDNFDININHKIMTLEKELEGIVPDEKSDILLELVTIYFKQGFKMGFNIREDM